ncbi:hypothetical protein CR513_01354, partial [Mucuna pruriens]
MKEFRDFIGNMDKKLLGLSKVKNKVAKRGIQTLELMSKKDNSSKSEEYRPMSLIGCTYKILAKALASWKVYISFVLGV